MVLISFISYLFFFLSIFLSTIYPALIMLRCSRLDTADFIENERDDSRSLSVVVPSRNEPRDLVVRNLVILSGIECVDDVVVVFDDNIDYVVNVVSSMDSMFFSRGIVVARFNSFGGRNSALSDGAKLSQGDVVFIADVDTVPSKELLCKAKRCIDVCVGIWNPYIDSYTKVEEGMAYITRFGSWIYYELRSRLNLFIYPLGSGTAIDKDLLKSIGFWRIDVIQDDIWLGFELMYRGIRPRLINSYIDVGVPKTLNAARVQQCRWSYGAMNIISRFLDRVIEAPIDLWRKLEALLYVFQPISSIFALLAFSTALICSIIERGVSVSPTYVLPIAITLSIQSLVFNIYSNKVLKIDRWKRIYFSGRVGAIYTLLSPLLGIYALRGLFRLSYRYRITPKVFSSRSRFDISEVLALSLSLPTVVMSFVHKNYVSLVIAFPLLLSSLYSLIRLEKG
ncbi:MAG: glycosyltransferase family 2 protein [Ignisphaera sp.]